MMPSLDYRLWAVITLIFCLGTAWSCVCRLNLISTKVMLKVRIKYTILMVGSLVFGGQPLLFGEWPGAASAMFAFATFLYVISGMQRWEYGPPDDANLHAHQIKR